MSFQRVIETARKTGVPVIITDVSGRDPMVVLSLEQFEAMAGEASPRQASRQARNSKLESMEEVLADLAVERAKDRIEETSVELKSLTQEGVENTDLSLEERFYIEPDQDKA